jgi:hypothetical protein
MSRGGEVRRRGGENEIKKEGEEGKRRGREKERRREGEKGRRGGEEERRVGAKESGGVFCFCSLTLCSLNGSLLL